MTTALQLLGRTRLLSACLLGALTPIAAPVFAQATTAQMSPGSLLDTAFAVLAIDDFGQYTAFIDSADLEDARRHLLAKARSLAAFGARDSTFAAISPVRELGFTSIGELDSLSPGQMYTRQLTQAVNPAHWKNGLAPKYSRAFLGQVSEGDSLVHGLYRQVETIANGGDPNDLRQLTTLEILTLRRKSGRWWIALQRGSVASPSPQSPLSGASAVVAAAFAAQDSRDIGQLVRAISPAEATRFKKRLLQSAEAEQIAAPPPPSTDRGSWPEAHPSSLQVVLHVPDRAALDSLSAETILNRWLTFTTFQATHHYPNYDPPMVARTVLGEVVDNDTTTYVLFRVDLSASSRWNTPIPPGSYTDVITTVLTPAGWRLCLDGGLIYDHEDGFSIGWHDEDLPDTVQ